MPERNQHTSEASFVNSCTFHKQVQDIFLRNQKQWENEIKAWWLKKPPDLIFKMEPVVNISDCMMFSYFFPSLLL